MPTPTSCFPEPCLSPVHRIHSNWNPNSRLPLSVYEIWLWHHSVPLSTLSSTFIFDSKGKTPDPETFLFLLSVTAKSWFFLLSGFGEAWETECVWLAVRGDGSDIRLVGWAHSPGRQCCALMVSKCCRQPLTVSVLNAPAKRSTASWAWTSRNRSIMHTNKQNGQSHNQPNSYSTYPFEWMNENVHEYGAKRLPYKRMQFAVPSEHRGSCKPI